MVGIFAKSELFTTFKGRIKIRDRIVGGTPKDPKVIEGWLRTHIPGIREEELRQRMLQSLYELGKDMPEDATYEEIVKASEALALKSAVGFRSDPTGLYIEGRYIKACLRECVNILHAGDDAKALKWGRTKKSPKGFFVERVFVQENTLYLGREAPDGVEPFLGHINGPDGPRSTLTYYEYCSEPELTFTVLVANDCLPDLNWATIWNLAEEIGVGAMRSQSFGKFDTLQWDRIETVLRKPPPEKDTVGQPLAVAE